MDELNTEVKRLTLLHAHDALALLSNCFSTPTLLYTLRTSECILDQFDQSLRDGLTKILNIDRDSDNDESTFQ